MVDFLPILEKAVEKANVDPRKLNDLHYLDGEIFMVPPNRPPALELYFDPQTVKGAIETARRRGQELRSDDEVYDQMTQIVVDAVREALSEYENGRLFAALIMRNLRSGRDAFTAGTDD